MLRKSSIFICSLIILNILIAPSFGISIAFGNNGGSSSANFNLDTSTSLTEKATLGDGTIFRTTQMSGSGNNEYSYQTSAKGSSANSAVKSLGVLSATTSTTASGEVVVLSQDVASSGDIVVSVQGKSDSTSAEQRIAGLYGHTTTSMSAFAGKDCSISGQSTKISGDAGATSSSSKSAENDMVVVGDFSGSGDLNTKLNSIAADRAGIYGTNSFNGQEVVNNNVLQTVAEGTLDVKMDGIYEDRKGNLGNFGVTATNKLKPSQNSVDFKPGGWAWAVPIHYKLSTNLIGSSTSTNANLWAQQISKGANGWDINTAANVFRGSDAAYTPGAANVLEFTTKNPSVGTYQGGTGDGNNNYMAVSKAVTGSTIAVTYGWYYTNQYVKGGFNKAAESDVYFNGNMAWRIAPAESRTTTNPKFDVRTIATHEVGHSLGLLDLYGSTDTNKIMYGYNNGQVKWSLTTADKLGLWTLYGP